MALIGGIIQPQAFEQVRDQLGAVLTTELASQKQQREAASMDASWLDVDVYAERMVPFDMEEVPAININIDNGQYSNKDLRQVDGTYTYNIDVYVTAESVIEGETVVRADKRAGIIRDKLLGIIRAIMESPKYRNLGIAGAQKICTVNVTGFSILDRSQDPNLLANTVGRLQVQIRVPEVMDTVDGVLIELSVTKVFLGLTDKGYLWQFEKGTPTLLGTEDGEGIENEEGEGVTPELSTLQVADTGEVALKKISALPTVEANSGIVLTGIRQTGVDEQSNPVFGNVNVSIRSVVQLALGESWLVIEIETPTSSITHPKLVNKNVLSINFSAQDLGPEFFSKDGDTPEEKLASDTVTIAGPYQASGLVLINLG